MDEELRCSIRSCDTECCLEGHCKKETWDDENEICDECSERGIYDKDQCICPSCTGVFTPDLQNAITCDGCKKITCDSQHCTTQHYPDPGDNPNSYFFYCVHCLYHATGKL